MKNYKYKVLDVKRKDKELKKMFKRCKTCKKLKLMNYFYKDKKMKDYRNNNCKTCVEEKASNRYTLKCEYCGKEFNAPKKKYKFCSTDCSNKYFGKINVGENNHFYGKTHSEESRKKMSKNHYDVSGKNNPMYGKNAYDYMDEETKQNKKTKQSKRMSGENHPLWNSEKTYDERIVKREYEEYYNWRRKVYEKDNYTCKCCGDKKGGNLNAHHIYGYMEYKELRTDINNGITLCEKCHKDYHKKYGYNNNNLKNFKMFLYDKWIETKNDNYIKIIEELNNIF